MFFRISVSSSLFVFTLCFLFGIWANLETQAASTSLPKRIQYHQQGLNKDNNISYRFGYFANNPTNPLSRHEVSKGPGHVAGSYAYVDANNLLQVVQYEAHPENGFRIVKQWTQKRDSTPDLRSGASTAAAAPITQAAETTIAASVVVPVVTNRNEKQNNDNKNGNVQVQQQAEKQQSQEPTQPEPELLDDYSIVEEELDR